MGNPLTDKQFTRLLDDRLTKVYVNEGKGLPNIIDKFYTRMKSKKAWEEFFRVGSVGDPEAFNGIIQYQSVSPGYHTKIEPKEYAGGMTIQRRLIDTDRYDVIEGLTKGLAVAANRKMNKIAHEPFLYFDSTAFTFTVSEEGVALCSDSHTTKTPDVSTSTGFDNLATLAFDASNLEALRIQSKGFKDDIGERIETNFDTIVHGTNLAEAVWEVINSSGKTGDNLNNENFQKGRWKSIELPLLDDTDTNDWFIVDSKAMKESLLWIDAVPLEFNSTTDFDTMMRKYADYFVIGWGFTDWRWIIGSSVS
jgi:hypothetical protein